MEPLFLVSRSTERPCRPLPASIDASTLAMTVAVQQQAFRSSRFLLHRRLAGLGCLCGARTGFSSLARLGVPHSGVTRWARSRQASAAGFTSLACCLGNKKEAVKNKTVVSLVAIKVRCVSLILSGRPCRPRGEWTFVCVWLCVCVCVCGCVIVCDCV